MNVNQIHSLDEGVEDMKKYIIPTLKMFYEGCVEAGFSEEQAFQLTRTLLQQTLERRGRGPK